ADYDNNLEENLRGLVQRLKDKSYRPKPARRVEILLFVTLLTPNYQKILQIKRRYSIIHSDTKYIRLFYPVPSYVIIAKLLTTKEAGTSPTKVWFPAPLNIDLSMYQQNHDNLICRRKQSHDSNFL
ncbi:MAG: hypothetical protein IKL28_09270, partial [Lachnospiraceae bacterium]|nr:hypothetical protein [Lachnospiraceae bacterium]